MKSISIIIPTLNEAETISKTIEQIKRIGDFEIIVCDGGSTDSTFKVAELIANKTILTEPCRAIQMNHGAEIATGSYLVFLHADTQLPDYFKNEVLTILDNPSVALGAFKLKIDSPKLSIRIIEFLTNLRSKIFKLPYGDQAFFIKKETFIKLGMFKELPIMEDFEFVCKAKKNGEISISKFPVRTSSRRWDKFGAIKTTVTNQIMILGYVAGIDIKKLAKFYRGE